MNKVVRFGDLVRNSGRPQTVTLWTKPQDNPAVSRAIEENRMLTVLQEAGKKDRGLIGFKQLPGALYLEFPRALTHEEDARVIGINYQLIDEPAVPEKDRAKPAKPPRPYTKPEEPAPQRNFKPVIQKPQQHEYTVKVRRTASLEDEITVNALDKSAAERQALERAKHMPFKPGKALRIELVTSD